MSQMNNLLALRTKKGEKNNDSQSKMSEMAKQSASGNLTSFSGIFSIVELNTKEREALQQLLSAHALDESIDLTNDLNALISLTSEVKAINNQAALLHGERIKKAHQILTHYRDGAFTGWLLVTYGNRQTPYNFLQYYEFYHALSLPLRLRMEEMPRQAIYTLASRNASLEKKEQVIKDYQGETKTVLLETIRKLFPLEKSDNRRENFSVKILQGMKKISELLQHPEAIYSENDKNSFRQMLIQLETLINN